MQKLITDQVPRINHSVTFGPKWDSYITHSKAQGTSLTRGKKDYVRAQIGVM